MKDVVIKDVERKTNLDKEILREAAVTAYSILEENSQNHEAHDGKAASYTSEKYDRTKKK